MARRVSGGQRTFCMEFVEPRILLSVAHSTESNNTPHIPKPTAAQIAAALKETVVEPIALPTRNGVQDNSTFPTAPATGGYSASQLLKTYGIDQVQNDGGIGAGQTIAIIDAMDDPDATTDMATFDTAMGLPAPPNFWIVGQDGGAVPAPSGSSGDSVETSLDIEWAHATAPQANILLVEADSLTDGDLIQGAVNWAETQTTYPNVSTISMSFGGPDSAGEESLNNYFTTPAGHTGITFIASSGDSGAYDAGTSTVGIQYPAASPNVLAIGGTTALSDAASNMISEIGWGFGTAPDFEGSGGGISTTEPQPTYQNGIVPQTSSWRTVPDVSFDADPDTGVAICDSYDNGSADPWEDIGGTSLAAPVWAGLISIVDQQRVNNGLGTLDGPTQTLPMIYALSSNDFHDITGGTNGVYNAGTGYDLVTGRGTPIVDKLVNDLSGQTAAADLTFSTPTGWQSPLVVTPTIGARTDAPFIAGTTLYVNWNGVNAGLAATNTPFHSELLVDGVVKQTLTTSSSVAAGGTFGTTDFSIGSLSAGTHTITVNVNYLNEQTETNTSNNVYIRKITVSATNLSDIRPYTPPGWSAPIVATNVSGGTTDTTLHTTDTVYLDISLANYGSSTTGSFFIALSLNGQIIALFDDVVITSDRYVYATALDFGSLAAGSYSVGLVNNFNQSSTETDYTNDDYLTSFTVLPSIGTISGTVFQDDNSDGTLDGADVGLSGQTVYLDVNNDGVLDSGDISTTTTTGGAFTFSNVTAGTYTVREIVPAGYVESSPAGNSYSVTSSAGQNLTGYTFGNFPIAYSDASGNDSYTLQLDPTATTLQILVNGTTTYSAPASIVPSLSFSPAAGNDTLTINGANGNPVPSGGITYDDGSNTNSDTLDILGSSGSDSFTANAGQVLFGSNAINFTNVQNLIIDPGAGSDTLAVNSGTVNIPAQTTGGGILARTFASLSVADGATLNIGTNSTSHPDRTLVVANSLSISSSGIMNLGGNDMIVHNGSLSTITALLAGGYNGGNWNGDGINSSAAANDSSKITALGVLLNSYNGSPYYTTFDGQPVATTDVLVKFTYYGDANLDGTVNGSDYSITDNGYNAQLSGWQNGDFNYDGSINGSDYELLDNTFNNPMPPL